MLGVPVLGFEPMPESIPKSEDHKRKLARWQRAIAQDGINVLLRGPSGAVAEETLSQARHDASSVVL